MLNPIPLTTDGSGPAGAIPVSISGLSGSSEVSWSDVSGKPTTFPPETHTHTVAQVTGLQAIINDLTARIEALESPAG